MTTNAKNVRGRRISGLRSTAPNAVPSTPTSAQPEARCYLRASMQQRRLQRLDVIGNGVLGLVKREIVFPGGRVLDPHWYLTDRNPALRRRIRFAVVALSNKRLLGTHRRDQPRAIDLGESHRQLARIDER